MTDTERLDHLERLVHEYGALLLHNGDNPHHYVGLGLANMGRTLRQAIDGSNGVKRKCAAKTARRKEAERGE